MIDDNVGLSKFGHHTADELAKTRITASRRITERHKLAWAWIEMHRPDVAEAIHLQVNSRWPRKYKRRISRSWPVAGRFA